jgi:hypothetical protein
MIAAFGMYLKGHSQTSHPSAKYTIEMYAGDRLIEAAVVDDYVYLGEPCVKYFTGDRKTIFCGTYRITRTQ